MSTVSLSPPSAAHDDAHDHGHTQSFFFTYVFSRDHKIIGIQFLFSTLIWFLIGGLLALGRSLADWPGHGRQCRSMDKFMLMPAGPDFAGSIHDALHDACAP